MIRIDCPYTHTHTQRYQVSLSLTSLIKFLWRQDNVVNIVKMLQAGPSGVHIPARARDVALPKCPH